MKKFLGQQGQLLIEILLAVAIAAIIIGAVSGLMMVGLKSGRSAGDKSAAVSLAQEGLEAMRLIGTSDWHAIYLPPDGTGSAANKGDGYPYYIYKNGSAWALSSNSANRDVTVNGVIYSRTIFIYNVSRQSSGDRAITASGGTDDPSTQNVKVVISYGGQETSVSEYFTRWKNAIYGQTDWSGGAGQSGPIVSPNSRYSSDDGNIDASVPGSIKLKQ